MKQIGRPLKKLAELGKRKRTAPTPAANRARGVDLQARKTANYETIKAGVLEAVANLPGNKRMWIPLAGTLPEIMVGLGLVLLGLTFESQTAAGGGRLYEGGSVIDFKVSLGAQPIAVRVQGDYWHTKGDRESKDAVQFDRLHAEGYLVADVWENDIYEAWLEGRLAGFVEDALLQAS